MVQILCTEFCRLRMVGSPMFTCILCASRFVIFDLIDHSFAANLSDGNIFY